MLAQRKKLIQLQESLKSYLMEGPQITRDGKRISWKGSKDADVRKFSLFEAISAMRASQVLMVVTFLMLNHKYSSDPLK